VVHLALRVRPRGEDALREDDVGAHEVDAHLDEDHVAQQHVEDHRRGVVVPRVPALHGEEVRAEEPDGGGDDGVEDLEPEHLDEARELLAAEGVVALHVVGEDGRQDENQKVAHDDQRGEGRLRARRRRGRRWRVAAAEAVVGEKVVAEAVAVAELVAALPAARSSRGPTLPCAPTGSCPRWRR
jgi:hypothetical protein